MIALQINTHKSALVAKGSNTRGAAAAKRI
jgi:hypothetical protein